MWGVTIFSPKSRGRRGPVFLIPQKNLRDLREDRARRRPQRAAAATLLPWATA